MRFLAQNAKMTNYIVRVPLLSFNYISQASKMHHQNSVSWKLTCQDNMEYCRFRQSPKSKKTVKKKPTSPFLKIEVQIWFQICVTIWGRFEINIGRLSPKMAKLGFFLPFLIVSLHLVPYLTCHHIKSPIFHINLDAWV